MSNLKQKKGAGGFSETESSEGERPPEPKKAHQPFSVSQIGQAYPPSGAQPPMASKSQSLVKPALATPAIRQLSKANPKPSVPPTPCDTPALEASLSNKAKSTAFEYDEPSRLVSVAACNRVQAEREMNKLHGGLENLQTQVDGRFNRMEERQTRIENQLLLVVDKLDILLNMAKQGGGALAPTTLASAMPQEEKPVLLNPPANIAHHAIAEGIQGRREQDKTLEQIPSEHKSQAMGLTRTVVKSMLGVKKLTEDAPPFYYKNGQPDFFPDQFKDATDYCRPFPHWDKSFANNYPWFSTYIDHFKRMSPDDGTAFATACKMFTDRQILVFLHDGPYSSLVSGWKRENGRDGKGNKDNVDDKTKKREVLRVEVKTFMRGSYRPELPEVAGSGWNAAWAKAVMSPEVTDDEGGKIIQQPGWRAGWCNNMYGSIDNAERAKELAKPGVHRPLAKHTIQVIDGPPPAIYTGSGKNKKVIQIPLVMISRRWHEDPGNAAWVESSAHLIDTTMMRKPNISMFLNAHPAPVEPNEPGAKEDGDYEAEDKDEGEDEGEEGMVGELVGAWARELEGGVYGGDGLDLSAGLGQVDMDEDDLYASDPGPTSVTPLHPSAPAPMEPRREPTPAQSGSKFQIDPEVLQDSSGARPRAHPRLHALNTTGPSVVPAVPSLAPMPTQPVYGPPQPLQPQYTHPGLVQGATTQVPYYYPPGGVSGAPEPAYPTSAPQTVPATSTPHPGLAPQHELSPLTTLPPQPVWPNPAETMPPPPTLSQQNRAAAANAAVPVPEPAIQKGDQKAGGQKSRQRPKKGEEDAPGPSTLATTTAETIPKELTTSKRKPGRPKGSKNKKTIEKERAEAEGRPLEGE
ncbi:hypothetical protein FRC11_004411 [Ceratobasidium sp. 423]|nr:hypothetical protein FRC11_004411 [Ceratobasidium sp. 423]